MKSYVIRERIPESASKSLEAFPEYVRHLLYHRGIDAHEKAEVFLSPDFDLHTHDPFLMKDMDRAVERIYGAIKAGERIAIYSDYDADGIPGGAVLHDLFKKIGYANFTNYIPDRHHEGFGLNSDAVESIAEGGAKLMITVDCGIADAAEVEHAKTLGLDVIVTDHHEAAHGLPLCVAVVDAKREDCEYPDKNLCGAAVAWKLVSAFLKKHGEEFGVKPGWEKWLLDLVGMATLSDMVPLVGENRVLAYYGLTVLRKTPRPGLNALLLKLRVNKKYLSEDDIGFSISPRINAASRMARPMDAFKLLVADNAADAEAYADHLEHVNNERKGTVAALVKEVKKIIGERYLDREKKVIVIGNPSWRPSLLGLAANSFADEHSCPVFLWGRDGGGVLKGSCRSGGEVSVLSLMQRASDVFLAYGGHAFSGGFEVSEEKIHTLQDALAKAYDELASEKEKAALIEYADLLLSLDDVSWRLYDDLIRLAPFGTGNEKPVLMFENVSPTLVKSFGKASEHLELVFKKRNGDSVSAIGFFMKPESFARIPESGKPVTLIGTLEKSTFKRTPELRLRIVDII